MSLPPGAPGPGGPGPDDPDGPDPRAMRPLGPAAPASAVAVGLLLGWLVRPGSAALDVVPPLVPWASVLVLGVVAGILALTAVATRRTLTDAHRTGRRLEPHRAVNRLVMARACAVGGALVAGGYAGYALSWVGLGTELADQRLARSLAAAVAAAAVVVAGLLLERACRVRSEDPDA